jgi:hypothetical protein
LRMELSWADIPDEVLARAAIEAMREPTLEMILAAQWAWPPYEGCIETETLLLIWHAMIDAAQPR